MWEQLTWENTELAMVFILFVVMRAMDRVFSKRVVDRMANYQLMYYNILWPVGVQFAQLLMCLTWVLYQRYTLGDLRYDLSFFLPYATIATAAGQPYSQWRLALFSLWDQLNAAITGIPGPYISQNDQGIMTNFTIIWTVIISIFYLGTRYDQEHYLGCALILMSGLVSIVVNLQTNDPPLGEYSAPGGTLQQSSAYWYLIYVVGTVPAGISNCYKQKCLSDGMLIASDCLSDRISNCYKQKCLSDGMLIASDCLSDRMLIASLIRCLKSVDLEVMYASWWSGNWQIMWGLLTFPLNWIPMPPPATNNPPLETGEFLVRAWACFFGAVPTNSTGQPYLPSSNVSTVTPSVCNVSEVSYSYNPGDEVCAAEGGSAALWFLIYIVFNVVFNVLLLWLTKRMSATWAQIGTVLCLSVL